jgi:hypothetical protein
MHRILHDEVAEVLGFDPSSPPEERPCFDLARISGTRRRLFVRSVFASIEASVYALKQEALSAPEAASRLSDAERALCSEQAFDLNDGGDVVARPAKLRFLPNLRFAFAVSAKVLGQESRLQTGDPRWEALTRSVKLRDRLTHPKRLADLTVTDAEFGDCLVVLVWFEVLMTGALIDHLMRDIEKRAETDEAVASVLRSLKADLPEHYRTSVGVGVR